MASAPPSGKKKGRKKAVPVALNDFLQTNQGAADGKAVTISKTGNSWADQMDFDQTEEKTVVLPTAPSSVRGGMNVDPDRIPLHGPFKVFIANVSYDADEEQVASMFQGLEVKSVHLPCDDSGRFKGFGYVEFGNRDDLIEALEMDDLEVAGRKLRIDLKTPSERDQQQSRGYSSFGREEDRDRAEDDGDWRSGPRTAPAKTTSDWRGEGGPPGGDRGGDDWRGGDRGPARSDRGGDSDWRSGPRGGDQGDRDRGGGGGGYGGFGRDREREPREPTMATRPGSKYEAVPSFNDYARGGGGGGGFSSDRRSDDRQAGREDRFGDRDRGYGGGYGSDRRGDDRGYGGRDDRYGDRDRGHGGGFGSDRRGDDRGYGGRDDRYGDRDRGGGGGFDRRDDRGGGGFDRRDDRGGGGFDRRDDRGGFGGDRGRDDRFGSRDGPRSDGSRDGPWSGAPRSGGDERPAADADRAPAERPKLNLKPRSVPASAAGADSAAKPAAAAARPAGSSSIFGGAKPVDTTAREREVEERLKTTRIDERSWTSEPRSSEQRSSEPASGSQRRAEASRDIRLTEPAQPRDSQKSEDDAGSSETNGKAADGGERRERAPRPPKTLEEKPAVFVEQSRFSALAEDDDA